ncbi:MAG: hypothetical protein M0R73_05675 [Dehalococcoidia bacterium]|nr:hypothetical protein [Dehalococcoidia bacterium]
MMKMLLLPVLAASVLALAFVSFVTPLRGATGVTPVQAGAWGQALVIDFGSEVTLPDGAVLGFVEVVEDSRCPADAMCAWQGRAVLAFTLDGERFEVEYLGEEQRVEVAGVRIPLRDVQPYPLASQPADAEDYEVTLVVSEGD